MSITGRKKLMMVVTCALLLAPALRAYASDQAPTVRPSATLPSPSMDGSDQDIERRQLRYAAREANAPHAAHFKSDGDGVGLTITSGLSVVLVVVMVMLFP